MIVVFVDGEREGEREGSTIWRQFVDVIKTENLIEHWIFQYS